jgi:hypothetical protein
MNIFQKYESELGYPTWPYINPIGFDIESSAARLESASLCNWLWDNFSIKIVVRFGVLSLYTWTTESELINLTSSGKVLKTKQQAYIDAFETLLSADNFIQNHQIKPL